MGYEILGKAALLIDESLVSTILSSSIGHYTETVVIGIIRLISSQENTPRNLGKIDILSSILLERITRID